MWITECNGHCGCNSEIEFFCHLRFDASHSEHWSQLLSCHEQITGLSETGTVQRDGEQYSNIFERKKKEKHLTWEASLINDLLCVCRFWVKMCIQSMKRQQHFLRMHSYFCVFPSKLLKCSQQQLQHIWKRIHPSDAFLSVPFSLAKRHNDSLRPY